MIIEVFPNLNDSMILWIYAACLIPCLGPYISCKILTWGIVPLWYGKSITPVPTSEWVETRVSKLVFRGYSLIGTFHKAFKKIYLHLKCPMYEKCPLKCTQSQGAAAAQSVCAPTGRCNNSSKCWEFSLRRLLPEMLLSMLLGSAPVSFMRTKISPSCS